MIDSARARGVSIDTDRLASQLGIPVVMTSASKREGIGQLKEAIKGQLELPGETMPRSSFARFVLPASGMAFVNPCLPT